MSDVNDVIVLDIGGSSARCGYAAEDSPCCRVPAVARKCGRDVEVHEAAPSESYNHEVSKSENPVHRGVVQDWDQLEQLWSICMENIGCNNPETYSVSSSHVLRVNESDQ
jgi:actin-related protein